MTCKIHLLFRKDVSIKEKAAVALANLQRNTCAMSLLRSRIEARIDSMLKVDAADGRQELSKMLELVKNSELLLNNIAGKVESVRYMEEFIAIIDSAAASVSEVKGDVEYLLPVAENALQKMHDAMLQMSSSESANKESQQKIIEEAIVAATAPEVKETKTELSVADQPPVIERKIEAELA